MRTLHRFAPRDKCAASWLKRSRVGSATPSPKAKASRVPSEGTNASRLAAASETAARMTSWSRSFAMRMAKSGAALGDDGGVELGRPLRHQAEEHAVFPALLGDARDGLAGRAEADALVAGRIAMRLLAHEQQLHRAVAPQAELERHAAEHGDHRIDHLGREAGKLHDRHRLAVGGSRNSWPSTSTMVSPPTLALSNMKA